MRVALASLAVALVLAFAPTSSSQSVDTTDYTVSVVDSDTTPFIIGAYDIVEVAVGEPGDGTVVFRGTVAEAPTAPMAGAFYFGFTTPAGDVVSGCTFGGAPDTRNIGEPIPPDSCVVAGALFYGVYAYGTVDVDIGSTITQVWAFTDGCDPVGDCLPADTAPGNLVDDWPALAGYGTDYTLTGCTRTGGCSAATETTTNSTSSNSTSNSTSATASSSTSASSSSATSSSSSSSTTATVSETTSSESAPTNNTSDEKDTPGLPVLASMGMVAIAFAAVRRRLR
jgi:hypothetical protein